MSSRAFLYIIAVVVVIGLIGLIVGQSFGTNEASVVAAQPMAQKTSAIDWAVLGLVASGLMVILLKPRKRRARSEERN